MYFDLATCNNSSSELDMMTFLSFLKLMIYGRISIWWRCDTSQATETHWLSGENDYIFTHWLCASAGKFNGRIILFSWNTKIDPWSICPLCTWSKCFSMWSYERLWPKLCPLRRQTVGVWTNNTAVTTVPFPFHELLFLYPETKLSCGLFSLKTGHFYLNSFVSGVF